MNWTMMIVLSAIMLLVPATLIAAFSVSKDKVHYDRHYDAHGFSVEACNDGKCKVTNADSIMVARQDNKARHD